MPGLGTHVRRTADAAVKKSEEEDRSLKLQVEAESEATKIRAEANAKVRRRQAAADAEAKRIAKTGSAEAEKILAIGRSTAEAYELPVKAMGEENVTRFKITEEIGRGQIRVIPDIVINSSGNGTEGSKNGLMELKLLEQIDERKTGQTMKIVDGIRSVDGTISEKK